MRINLHTEIHPCRNEIIPETEYCRNEIIPETEYCETQKYVENAIETKDAIKWENAVSEEINKNDAKNEINEEPMRINGYQ